MRIEKPFHRNYRKMIDEKEEETELLNPKYKSPIPQNLRWHSFAKDDEGMTGDALILFINNELLTTAILTEAFKTQ